MANVLLEQAQVNLGLAVRSAANGIDVAVVDDKGPAEVHTAHVNSAIVSEMFVQKAGLMPGDCVISIGGITTRTVAAFNDVVREACKPMRRIEIVVVREKERISTELTVGKDVC